MIEIKKKVDCCGCTACMNVCPVQAIAMKEDEEGFLYPNIDKNKCINCGLCEKVCPIKNRVKEEKKEQTSYIVNNKNSEERKQSTSGSAFSPIAKYVIKKGGVVFGVTFDKDFNVKHTYVEDEKELIKFRGSKYVQSNPKETFKQAKNFLENDKWVCYSGTPCQIEGLKNFLGKEYKKLITVDVVCRAVPSPLVWKKYLKYQKEKNGIEQYQKAIFRDKSKYGYKYSTMTLKSENKEYNEGVETDPYLRAFFSNLSDRPCCYECKFRKQYRVSDFTIWDCFNVEDYDKKLDDDKGSTRVLIHTEKGLDLFNDIKGEFDLIQVEPDILVKDVQEMFKSVKANPKREEFFKELNQLEEGEFFKKWFPNTVKVRIEKSTRMFLNKIGIYKKAKKIAKKLIDKGGK